MTSLPIMWFALFDFEHLKDTFLHRFELYHLGMKSQCFSSVIFLKWLFTALAQGFFIYLVGMISMTGASVK